MRHALAIALMGWTLWTFHVVRPDGTPEGSGHVTATQTEAGKTRKECVLAHQRAVLQMHRDAAILTKQQMEKDYGAGRLSLEPDGVQFTYGKTGLILWQLVCSPDTVDPRQ